MDRIALALALAAVLSACGSSRTGECTFNSECPARHSCVEHACVEGCTSDDECVALGGPSATCDPFGICVGGTDGGPGMDGGSRDGGPDARVDLDGAPDAPIAMDAPMLDAPGLEDAPMLTDVLVPPDASRDPVATSAEIAAVRAAAAGAISPALPVDDAIVTYVLPAIGADPAGLFVQSEAAGPALFVAIDPATLTPSPSVGDLVSFEVAETMLVGGQHRVTMIGSFARTAVGLDASSLAQDVSARDVVTMLDALESELVRGDLVLTEDVTGTCGAMHACAQATSAGVPTASTMHRFRTLPEVVSAHGLRAGCAIHFGPTPMWRFAADAQPSAFQASEVSVTSCPAFRVLSAVATSATSIVVTFDAPLDPASVMSASFTVTGGVGVSGVSVSGTTATLTTTAIAPGTYTVTVASTARDVSGGTIDPAMRSAMFTYASCSTAHLVLNEVDYDSVGSDSAEFVEIHNPTGSAVSLAGYTLALVNGSSSTTYATIDLSTAGAVPAGGYLVIANATVTVAPGAVVLAWPGASDQIQNGAPDGVALVSGGAVIDALSYEGSLPAATVTGVTGTVSLVEGTATTAADSNTTPGSLTRRPNGCDTDDASADWQLATTPTPGAAN